MTKKKTQTVESTAIAAWQLHVLMDALRDHELVMTRLYRQEVGSLYMRLVEQTRAVILKLLEP